MNESEKETMLRACKYVDDVVHGIPCGRILTIDLNEVELQVWRGNGCDPLNMFTEVSTMFHRRSAKRSLTVSRRLQLSSMLSEKGYMRYNRV